MKKAIYQFIFFKLMGWKIVGTINPELKKCVMAVVTHTSWHDFFIGVFTRGCVGLEMNFVAKKELYTFPLGYYFDWMGGASLDRTGGLNKVDTIAQIFKKRETFRLAIAPEGTRKKVIEWKTGFYYIALKANVPILPIAFDFSKKEVRLGEPLNPSGDYEADCKILRGFYKGAIGKVPEYSFEVLD